MSDDPTLVAAAIDALVAGEHPGLRVWTARVDARPGRTPRELRDRLRLIADRLRGPQAVALRSKPVPWAYRVLFRHLGIDPDVVRTPLEALVLDRLMHGGFTSGGVPEDALALATLETGVPLWAFDAARVGALRLATGADGRLTLSDDAGPAAVLFEPPLQDRAPGRDTTALVLVAVQAPGVEDIYVEEAVWTAAAAMPTIDAPS
jgi:DNA/RNA-binding domain of Phe-tRNA-synthetase-like protein